MYFIWSIEGYQISMSYISEATKKYPEEFTKMPERLTFRNIFVRQHLDQSPTFFSMVLANETILNSLILVVEMPKSIKKICVIQMTDT